MPVVIHSLFPTVKYQNHFLDDADSFPALALFAAASSLALFLAIFASVALKLFNTNRLLKYPSFLPKPHRYGLLWGSQTGILLGVPRSLVRTYEFLLRTKINSIWMEILD